MSTPFSPGVSRRKLLAAAVSAPLSAGVGLAAPKRDTAKPRHVIIVGDSQIDGTLGWPEIIIELARDDTQCGTFIGTGPGDPDIFRELNRRIPHDASDLVLATGREELRRLASGPSSVVDTFTRLATTSQEFTAYYSSTLEAALATELPVTVCTLMGERSADPFRRRIADVTLAIANDAITREASRNKLPMLDLRLIDQSATPREIAGSLLMTLGRS
jgi:hypothetical protein